ncbi:hypothetical protein [Streptomyces canus]|uniref:hypothetical protein n=1 Tax=Streptomyces canus TaxID=58343 RepID=UPI0003819EEF|nr:hypothetical protein [Streptomyces canus]
MTFTGGTPGRAALHLARAASFAPSAHNSQPWFFVEEGHDGGFEVQADPGRRMALTDPDAREMVAAATQEEESPAQAMPLRHTHRGPFGPEPVTEELLSDLRDQARSEGVILQMLDVPEMVGMLARLVHTAERAVRADLWRAVEPAHGVGPTGVPVAACRAHPDLTLLAGRDYLGLSRRYTVPERRRGAGTGIVAVLCTPYDHCADWLLAGQALQRVLLCTAGHAVMAGFHTQSLERPDLREEMRRWVTAGRHPQMALRLGRPPHVRPTLRRPLRQVLTRAPVPLVR